MKESMQDELVTRSHARFERAQELHMARHRRAMVIVGNDEQRCAVHAAMLEHCEELAALAPRRRRNVVHGNDRRAIAERR
jgi:hypothetical protein